MKHRSIDSVVIVGAGLSGLAAGALLAKRGLSVEVVEQQDRPGGACSAFRRGDVTYDSGAAMLFGFGTEGFNPHNWLMNELGVEIDMYRHEALYRLYYGDDPITFHYDIDRYLDELSSLFPGSMGQIRDFYSYIEKLYSKVIAPVTLFEAPGDMPLSEMRAGMKSNFSSQLKMISLLFSSTYSLMKKFIKDEAARRYFDKLTSTYSYTTIEETPAVMAATMFVDNHKGGSYYPAGSLHNFALNLDPDGILPARWKKKILGQELTMPSFVVYGTVGKSAVQASRNGLISRVRITRTPSMPRRSEKRRTG